MIDQHYAYGGGFIAKIKLAKFALLILWPSDVSLFLISFMCFPAASKSWMEVIACLICCLKIRQEG